MTVGIGAICDGGKAAVIAADRELSLAGQLRMEMEGSKIEPLGDASFVVTSATWALSDTMLMRLAKMRSSLTGLTVGAAVDQVWEWYKDARQEFLESKVLRKALGVGYAEFRQMAPTTSSLTIHKVIDDLLAAPIPAQLLVVGSDQSGDSHVYCVQDGGILSCDDRSFGVVGSGIGPSYFSLIRRHQSKSTPLAESIYYVYEAKKKAEISNGVGEMTDLCVLRNGASERFAEPHPVIELLQQKYEKLRQPRLDHDDVSQIQKALASLA
jgi:hypothetical protein